MDVVEQLQAYTLQILSLGQAALAAFRRGERLPDELAALAEDLLALEAAVKMPVAADDPSAELDAAFDEPETLEEWPAPADEGPAVDAASNDDAPIDIAPIDIAPIDVAPIDVAPIDVASTVTLSQGQLHDELAPLFTALPNDDDDWLKSLVDEPVEATAAEDLIVLDVEQEPGGGPSDFDTILAALPPLVVEVPAELPPAAELELEPAPDQPAWSDEAQGVSGLTVVDDPGTVWPLVAIEAAARTEEQDGKPALPEAVGPAFCFNCGAELRPGKRFCYRCGTPVAMPAEPEPAAGDGLPIAPIEDLPTPRPAPLPLSEMPTIIGGPYREEPAPARANPNAADDLARFCNNCGLAVAANVQLCPECGSQDIS